MCVCVCVGHNRGPTKTTEPIEMPFGAAAWTGMRPQNHALGGGAGIPWEGALFWLSPGPYCKVYIRRAVDTVSLIR